jgi:hypothetical protein
MGYKGKLVVAQDKKSLACSMRKPGKKQKLIRMHGEPHRYL